MGTQQCTLITITSLSRACSAAEGGDSSPTPHEGHIKLMQVLCRAVQPKTDGRACVTPSVSCCSSRLHLGAQHSANIGGAARRGVAPARSLQGWIPPLPPQTSVQMLTGVARLDFRYERQRVRVELLGKRHRESQSLIGIPAWDESPRLPVPARAERGHWSRAVKATHRQHWGRAPLPRGLSALSPWPLAPHILRAGAAVLGNIPAQVCAPHSGWSPLPRGSGVSAAPIPVIASPMGLDPSVNQGAPLC